MVERTDQDQSLVDTYVTWVNLHTGNDFMHLILFTWHHSVSLRKHPSKLDLRLLALVTAGEFLKKTISLLRSQGISLFVSIAVISRSLQLSPTPYFSYSCNSTSSDMDALAPITASTQKNTQIHNTPLFNRV